jgi:hypothetical protein
VDVLALFTQHKRKKRKKKLKSEIWVVFGNVSGLLFFCLDAKDFERSAESSARV